MDEQLLETLASALDALEAQLKSDQLTYDLSPSEDWSSMEDTHFKLFHQVVRAMYQQQKVITALVQEVKGLNDQVSHAG